MAASSVDVWMGKETKVSHSELKANDVDMREDSWSNENRRRMRTRRRRKRKRRRTWRRERLRR